MVVLGDIPEGLQQSHRVSDQVVEVDRAGPQQPRLVLRVDVGEPNSAGLMALERNVSWSISSFLRLEIRPAIARGVVRLVSMSASRITIVSRRCESAES